MKKHLLTTLSLVVVATTVAACGGTDKETTVVHDRPVVVQQPNSYDSASPSSVESQCKHGYDNSSHSCY